MKFTTHNDANISTGGTHLQGYLQANYADLVKVFGQPFGGDNHKTDAEWEVCFEDGTRATIYNWKNGKNYCGEDGLEVQKIKEWNIGGFNQDAVDRVLKALHATDLTDFFA
jgi:hypothetical protein